MEKLNKTVDKRSGNFILEFSYKILSQDKQSLSLSYKTEKLYFIHINDAISAIFKLINSNKLSKQYLILTYVHSQKTLIRYDKYCGISYREDSIWFDIVKLKYLQKGPPTDFPDDDEIFNKTEYIGACVEQPIIDEADYVRDKGKPISKLPLMAYPLGYPNYPKKTKSKQDKDDVFIRMPKSLDQPIYHSIESHKKMRNELEQIMKNEDLRKYYGDDNV